MKHGLTDLDALLLSVRHPLSRSYIEEAIQAYRVGSLKAAIVATWVAVTFDIIQKIRQLSEYDDAAASAFVESFDQQVSSGNKAKLLEIEGDLLNTASNKFELIDRIEKQHFERLKDDRNLCAHPAFTNEGVLFTPQPELVRLYIVEAVTSLLSQQPMQGKTILSQFDGEFKSDAFPSTEDAARKFVAGRYLKHSRPSVHVNLGKVFAKALLKQAPAGWEGKTHLLNPALQALKEHDPALWAGSLLPYIVQLVEESDPDTLNNAFSIIARFTDVRIALSGETNTRLRSIIENAPNSAADLRPYEAVDIPEFRKSLTMKFAVLDQSLQEKIVLRFPSEAYWPNVLQSVANARSFRSAEHLFAKFIMPYETKLSAEQLSALLEAVASNDQVGWAHGVQDMLKSMIEATARSVSFAELEIPRFRKLIADESAFCDQHEQTIAILRLGGANLPASPADP